MVTLRVPRHGLSLQYGELCVRNALYHEHVFPVYKTFPFCYRHHPFSHKVCNRAHPERIHEQLTVRSDAKIEIPVDARNRHNDTMKITARQLESLIRLSEASARTRLSTVVTESDAMLATGILDYYLRDVATVGGKVDVDMINIGMSQRQRSDLELIITTIRNSTRKDGFITREDLETLCESKNISKARVDKIVQDLMNDGQVYEGKRPGELKAVL